MSDFPAEVVDVKRFSWYHTARDGQDSQQATAEVDQLPDHPYFPADRDAPRVPHQERQTGGYES